MEYIQYIQLDENGIVHTVCELGPVEENERIIAVENLRKSTAIPAEVSELLGQKFDRVNKRFEKVPDPVPVPAPEPIPDPVLDKLDELTEAIARLEKKVK